MKFGNPTGLYRYHKGGNRPVSPAVKRIAVPFSSKTHCEHCRCLLPLHTTTCPVVESENKESK